MQKGWIKLYRSLLENDLWQEKRVYSRAEAWLELLLTVNHEAGNVLVNGKLVSITSGERLTSMEQLAERWGWSRTKVKDFLNLLQSQQMIVYKTTSKYTVVTILKWDVYQNESLEKNHQKGIKKTSENHQKSTNKNGKNIYTCGGGRGIHAREPEDLAMSLEVGVEASADNHPIHSQEVFYYHHLPTTAHELKQVREFTDKLFTAYRKTSACEADVERVYEQVYRRVEVGEDTAIAVFDKDKAALLEYAFQQGVEGGQTSWNYINGIYNNFAKRGIETVDDAERYAFERKMGGL